MEDLLIRNKDIKYMAYLCEYYLCHDPLEKVTICMKLRDVLLSSDDTMELYDRETNLLEDVFDCILNNEMIADEKIISHLKDILIEYLEMSEGKEVLTINIDIPTFYKELINEHEELIK